MDTNGDRLTKRPVRLNSANASRTIANGERQKHSTPTTNMLADGAAILVVSTRPSPSTPEDLSPT